MQRIRRASTVSNRRVKEIRMTTAFPLPENDNSGSGGAPPWTACDNQKQYRNPIVILIQKQVIL